MRLPAKVYALRHEGTGKIYVGMSSRLKQRIQHHMSSLRIGKHPVEDLQFDYNNHGKEITVIVLDEVQDYDERKKEFAWQIKLRTLDRRYGYNYKDPVTKWYNREYTTPQT